MQLKQLAVAGLFKQYNHTVPFPLSSEDNPEPSVVLLCGENGVGKTRLLRMLDGFMKLDFTAFREVPFTSAKLTFSDNSAISVTPARRKMNKASQDCLRVEYGTHEVDLSLKHPGPLVKEESEKVEMFREAFFSSTSSITVRFVATGRLQQLYTEHEAREKERQNHEYFVEMHGDEAAYYEEMARRQRPRDVLLSDRIRRFIRDAQLNYSRYFSRRTPDLFPKIIESLTEKSASDYSAKDLISRLETVARLDEVSGTYGLYQEPWNLDQLKRILSRGGENAPDAHALTVTNTYVEFLESRASERSLLIERLQTFEQSANEFLKDKSVAVHMRDGLRIKMKQGGELSEVQLSSGEYHLLYLLVTAVTTQHRGTVIAIDEPERKRCQVLNHDIVSKSKDRPDDAAAPSRRKDEG